MATGELLSSAVAVVVHTTFKIASGNGHTRAIMCNLKIIISKHEHAHIHLGLFMNFFQERKKREFVRTPSPQDQLMLYCSAFIELCDRVDMHI